MEPIEVVWGGGEDVISLEEERFSGVIFFFQWVGNGKSKGLTPTFSLWNLVNIPEYFKDDVTLPFDILGWINFSHEMDIPSNPWIKFWTSGGSVGIFEEFWPTDLGSVLGYWWLFEQLQT